MERRLSNSLILCILSLVVIINASIMVSGQDTELFFTNTTLIQHEQTTTMLRITNATDVAVVSMNITWDPTSIAIEEINTSYPHSDFDSVFTLLNSTQGTLEIDAYQFGTDGLSDTIAVLQLTLIPITKETQQPSTTLEITENRLYDSNQQPITHTAYSSTISITSNPVEESNSSLQLIIIAGIILFIIFLSVFIIRKTQQKKH